MVRVPFSSCLGKVPGAGERSRLLGSGGLRRPALLQGSQRSEASPQTQRLWSRGSACQERWRTILTIGVRRSLRTCPAGAASYGTERSKATNVLGSKGSGCQRLGFRGLGFAASGLRVHGLGVSAVSGFGLRSDIRTGQRVSAWRTLLDFRTTICDPRPKPAGATIACPRSTDYDMIDPRKPIEIIGKLLAPTPTIWYRVWYDNQPI